VKALKTLKNKQPPFKKLSNLGEIMKALQLTISLLSVLTAASVYAADASNPYAGKTRSEIAKMQLGSFEKLVSAVAPVVNGVTGFVNNTVPLLKKLPDIAGDTVQCARSSAERWQNNCSRLNSSVLAEAKLPMPPVQPGLDQEIRYAFALYNFSSILSKLGDGFFAQIDGGAIKSGTGLLAPFVGFMAYAQPQETVLADAKNRLNDLRINIESLRKALKFLADGLKNASVQKNLKAEARAAKEADPFAPESISFDEPVVMEEAVAEPAAE
jgi:hypothetical protein